MPKSKRSKKNGVTEFDIPGIQYAISEVVARVDEFFGTRVKNLSPVQRRWKPCSHGLKAKISYDYENRIKHATARVIPVDWPADSVLYFRFWCLEKEWSLRYGQLDWAYLECNKPLNFKPSLRDKTFVPLDDAYSVEIFRRLNNPL